MRHRPDFDAYVTSRSPHLIRLGYLLTHDWQAAEDLVQTALIKAWSAWNRLDGGDPDGYVRRIVVTTHLSWRRRRWTGEVPGGDLADRANMARTPDEMAAVDERDRLWRILAELPPRQRTVLVLRYFEDLSEEQVAEVMGISIGGVKSQASRALIRLREVAGVRPESSGRPSDDRPSRPVAVSRTISVSRGVPDVR